MYARPLGSTPELHTAANVKGLPRCRHPSPFHLMNSPPFFFPICTKTIEIWDCSPLSAATNVAPDFLAKDRVSFCGPDLPTVHNADPFFPHIRVGFADDISPDHYPPFFPCQILMTWLHRIFFPLAFLAGKRGSFTAPSLYKISALSSPILSNVPLAFHPPTISPFLLTGKG